MLAQNIDTIAVCELRRGFALQCFHLYGARILTRDYHVIISYKYFLRGRKLCPRLPVLPLSCISTVYIIRMNFSASNNLLTLGAHARRGL